jgi:hypothetical protein
MQPSYLPWMGYFALMDSVDTFVFYDDVQLSRQSWQQRNRIKTSQGVQWLTIPIFREGYQRICDIKINYAVDWQRVHWKTIEQAYSKAPYFKTYAPYISDLYRVKWFLLSDYTMYVIDILSQLLNIKIPKIYKSSSLQAEGHKTDRLLTLLKNIGATEYISAPAARDYLESEKFTDIKLKWFEYNHPVYPQIRGDFLSHMSVIDLLFNTGDKAIEYIRSGINQNPKAL